MSTVDAKADAEASAIIEFERSATDWLLVAFFVLGAVAIGYFVSNGGLMVGFCGCLLFGRLIAGRSRSRSEGAIWHSMTMVCRCRRSSTRSCPGARSRALRWNTDRKANWNSTSRSPNPTHTDQSPGYRRGRFFRAAFVSISTRLPVARRESKLPFDTSLPMLGRSSFD